ncbi:seryl-tRNA synthetase [mine drainage metagenome]|uniref:Serine--tRNA ligase n=2 Tax=mine drainage metagenome TaxID=410659 RepID=T1AZC6_9ZZZZ
MIDIKLLRNDPDTVVANLARRGFPFDSSWYREQEGRRKAIQIRLEDLRSQRNEGSKTVGKIKSGGGSPADLAAQMERLTQINRELEVAEQGFRRIEEELEAFHLTLPNLIDDSVPDGANATQNIEIRRAGTLPQFNFQARDHVAIGEQLACMSFAEASRMVGARFVVLKGALAQLQRALINFMMDVHVLEQGYEEVYVPHLVNRDSLTGTGQLPKFEPELFRVAKTADWYLIPTAEVPVTNLARDRIFRMEELPRRWVAHTPCYRSEAGSYGKDLRGMIRQHQFEKVELVTITTPDHSADALETLTVHAETILKKLELPYRVMLLCAGDTGFASAKTYDLEVWLPGQNQYREISSCSNCRDFQARRLQARWRSHAQDRPEWVHTLNGSALAVGRTLVALLENRQDEGGRISIPEPLRPYIGGLSHLESTRRQD